MFLDLNHCTFDPELEKAVLFAVGNTLVCDDLDEAKRLSWTGERFKGCVHVSLFICNLLIYLH